MSRTWSLLILLAAASALPRDACAQVIRGEIREAGTGTPLGGAMVELRDGSGRSLSRVLSSPSGRYSLRSLGEGEYQLRLAAIGYEPTSVALTVAGGSRAEVPPVELSPSVQALPDLVAQAESRGCANRDNPGGVFKRIIDRAATALSTIELTIREGEIAFTTSVIESRSTVWPAKSSSADTLAGHLLEWPIRSNAPDSLRQAGFAQQIESGSRKRWVFHGPDERVLFADWFLDSHCFRVVKDGPGDAPYLLRFTPRGSAGRVDLSGYLAIDPNTMAPQRLVYRHENLPGGLPNGSAGGEVEFMRVGARLWVPARWRMYAPIPSNSQEAGRLVIGQVERVGRIDRIEPRPPRTDQPPEDTR